VDIKQIIQNLKTDPQIRRLISRRCTLMDADWESYLNLVPKSGSRGRGIYRDGVVCGKKALTLLYICHYNAISMQYNGG